MRKQNTQEIKQTVSDQLESSFDVNDRQMDTEYLQTMNLKLQDEGRFKQKELNLS